MRKFGIMLIVISLLAVGIALADPGIPKYLPEVFTFFMVWITACISPSPNIRQL